MAGDPGIRRLIFAVALVLAVAGCGRTGIDFEDYPPIDRSAKLSTVQVDMLVDRKVAEAYDLTDDVFSGGSGWVANAARGEIVTNAHVAVSGQRPQVSLPNSVARKARVVAADVCHDIALLETEAVAGLRTMPRAEDDSVRRGDKVFTVGFPYDGGGPALRGHTGVVRRPDIDSYDGFPSVMRLDAITLDGQSGGPVLDTRGRIVAMNTFGEDPPDPVNFAITLRYIEQRLPLLRRGESLNWTGWAFDTSYADPDAPVVEGLKGDRDFYGWGVVGRTPGTEPVGGLVGDAGGVEQYVYAIDGQRFGNHKKDIPADADEQVACSEIGSHAAGETVSYSIVEPEYDEDTGDVTDYETFDVRVKYR